MKPTDIVRGIDEQIDMRFSSNAEFEPAADVAGRFTTDHVSQAHLTHYVEKVYAFHDPLSEEYQSVLHFYQGVEGVNASLGYVSAGFIGAGIGATAAFFGVDPSFADVGIGLGVGVGLSFEHLFHRFGALLFQYDPHTISERVSTNLQSKRDTSRDRLLEQLSYS